MTELNLGDVAERHEAYKLSHAHEGAFACCKAHASADDVPRLLAEIKRLSDDNEMVRELLAEEAAGLTCAWDAAKSWNARAETAEAEVKRLRDGLNSIAADLETASAEGKVNVHPGTEYTDGRRHVYAAAAWALRCLLDGGQV
jgi:hypothetical protein